MLVEEIRPYKDSTSLNNPLASLLIVLKDSIEYTRL
jgi:hypothetical protein